jgi:pimeloyl-ACP methyl ester carboxylesterase
MVMIEPVQLPRRAFIQGAAALAAALPGVGQAAAAPIDEGQFVRLNGVEQWVAIRGRDPGNPVLLVLGGGPGAPTSYLAPAFADWEQHFTVVLWDQPGSGGTFLKNGGELGIGTVSVDRYAADGLALADYLMSRFGRRKIVLLGYSWGSMVGLTMAARRPGLFSAYVGTGQAVDVRQADALSYGLVLKAARERGDTAAVAALERLGPPPYDFDQRTTKQGFATALTPLERANAGRIGPLLAATPADAKWLWPKELGVYDARAAFLGTQQRGYADAQAWSARPLGLQFRLPMFFFQGEQDLNTVTALVQAYAAELKAPKKDVALIAGAGHGTVPYCCAELLALMTARVLPAIRA